MMFSGGLIAFFIVFHLLHFTVGVLPLGEFKEGEVYRNLSASFSADYWFVPVFYIITMVVIGLHLNHGLWSLFQTLGLDNPDRNKIIRIGSTVTTVLIIAGFIAIPLAFLTGQMPTVEEAYKKPAASYINHSSVHLNPPIPQSIDHANADLNPQPITNGQH